MSNLIKNIEFITAVIVFFYVIFETDAIPEYAKLFKLKFLKYEEFFKEKGSNFATILNYPGFLLKKWPNFGTKLFECYICLTIWACLFFSVITNEWKGLPFNIIGVWIGYPLLTFILRKLNS